MSEPEWVFEKKGPANEGEGGASEVLAVSNTFKDFVRESVQNANDAIRHTPGGGEIVFTFYELEDEDLDTFKQGMNWEELVEHVKAQDSGNTAARTKDYVDYIESGGSLRLLTIEDRNGIGVTGDEDDEDGHFWSLTKGTLHTTKGDVIGSGGTKGIGKAVYLGYSALNTFFLNSNLTETPEGKESPRFFGKASLSDHNLEDTPYQRNGYFGQKTETDRGERAESMWGADAKEIAESLNLKHEDISGTKVGIVGLEGEGVDRDMPIEEIIEKIDEYAAQYFWPTLMTEDRSIEIKKEGDDPVDVSIKDREVDPFIECYEAYLNGKLDEELEKPGDIVRRDITVDIPNRTERAPGDRKEMGEGTITLVIRRASEDTDNKMEGNVAMFRGAKMIVKYRSVRNIPGAYPFHAILVGGQARRDDEKDQSDEDMEHFLAAAEPPQHKWWKTEQSDLDAFYEESKKIKELHDAWQEALSEIITPEIEEGMPGPDDLSEKFPLGNSLGGGRQPKPLGFSNVNGWFDDDRYFAEAEIFVEGEVDSEWTATIELESIGEDDAKIDALPVESIAVENNQVDTEVEDGVAKITVPEGIGEVVFTAQSKRIENPDSVGEARGNIRGSVELSEG